MPAALRGYSPIVVQRVSKRTGRPYHYTVAYTTPRGNRISRREYDSRRIRRETGNRFRNRSELEAFRESVGGSDWLVDIRHATGRAPTAAVYADWREVNERRAALRARHPNVARGSRLDQLDPALVAPNGPLARLLDASGRREMRPGVAVGAS